MAAKAAAAPGAEAQLAFWERFQQEAAVRVRDCNSVAGECLWLTRRDPGPAFRFTIQSASRPGDSVECTLEVAEGTLTCRPGPAIAAGVLQFLWTGGGHETLRLGSDTFTLAEVLTLILDQLVDAECDLDLQPPGSGEA